MDAENWQRLQSLESRDIVSMWFKSIHGTELNARRANEVNAAARQGRDFFKSASEATYAVRPLLTYYGVASLGRALTLLFRKAGGEEGLTQGHGLETIDWRGQLSGEIPSALLEIGNLRVKTCRGSFADFVAESGNSYPILIASKEPDWGFGYDVPALGHEFTLSGLLSRLPDMRDQQQQIGQQIQHVLVSDVQYDRSNGATFRFSASSCDIIESQLKSMGYRVTTSNNSIVASINGDAISGSSMPQLLHTYVRTMIGIPTLYLVPEFAPNVRYSQVAVTYVLSFYLGMLARYFPTHWSGLLSGTKGDAIWPSINAAQNYVEAAFPRLAFEMIEYSLKVPDLK